MYHKTLANQLMLLQIMGSPETIIIFVFFNFVVILILVLQNLGGCFTYTTVSYIKKRKLKVGDKYVYTFYQSVIGRVEELDDCFLADWVCLFLLKAAWTSLAVCVCYYTSTFPILFTEHSEWKKPLRLVTAYTVNMNP